MTTFKINPDAPIIYSEKFIVRSYHVDINRKLTVQSLCGFFQEVAGNHTVACGVGWEIMQNNHIFWVLSRLKIEVSQYPVWKDEITIKSWSNGLDGFMAIRNFQVEGSNGEILVKAVSAWLMVNTETRRLVRADEYMQDFPLHTERLFNENPGKVAILNQPVTFAASSVSYTETDMNLHMNNVSYIDRIINTFPLEFLQKHTISEFEINFLKEAVTGDMLMVQQQKIEDEEFLNNIVQSENGKEMVRTKMKWITFQP